MHSFYHPACPLPSQPASSSHSPALLCSGTMPEASTALCAGLLGAKVLYHLRRYRSLRSAFDSAKADVKQLASDERELPLPAAGGEAERPARGAAGQPAAPSAAAQQLDRTPAVGTGRQQAAVPEVSPLIQRGEAQVAPCCMGPLAGTACQRSLFVCRLGH